MGLGRWVHGVMGEDDERDLQESKSELQEKILDLEKFEEVVVGRELKMIALEKEIENLKQELEKVNRGQGKWT